MSPQAIRLVMHTINPTVTTSLVCNHTPPTDLWKLNRPPIRTHTPLRKQLTLPTPIRLLSLPRATLNPIARPATLNPTAPPATTNPTALPATTNLMYNQIRPSDWQLRLSELLRPPLRSPSVLRARRLSPLPLQWRPRALAYTPIARDSRRRV